jgi:hypothetical protein
MGQMNQRTSRIIEVTNLITGVDMYAKMVVRKK